MKLTAFGLALMFAAVFVGCAQTHVAETNPEKKYAPTENVEVLFSEPSRPYEVIALLDSIGGVGVSDATLINDMRNRAKRVGANALVVVRRGKGTTQQQPLLGGYQTMGGDEYPKLQGIAIS